MLHRCMQNQTVTMKAFSAVDTDWSVKNSGNILQGVGLPYMYDTWYMQHFIPLQINYNEELCLFNA